MGVSTRSSKTSSVYTEPSKVRCSTALWKVKCAVSLLTGVILGLIPVRGAVGFICFLVVQSAVGQLFLAAMKLPDYVLDQMEALTDHIVMSFSCFVVSWVLTYSLWHY